MNICKLCVAVWTNKGNPGRLPKFKVIYVTISADLPKLPKIVQQPVVQIEETARIASQPRNKQNKPLPRQLRNAFSLCHDKLVKHLQKSLSLSLFYSKHCSGSFRRQRSLETANLLSGSSDEKVGVAVGWRPRVRITVKLLPVSTVESYDRPKWSNSNNTWYYSAE